MDVVIGRMGEHVFCGQEKYPAWEQRLVARAGALLLPGGLALHWESHLNRFFSPYSTIFLDRLRALLYQGWCLHDIDIVRALDQRQAAL